MLATLVHGLEPVDSPWHPTGPAGPVRHAQLGPGVWVLRTPRWVHAEILDTHENLPAPVVDADEVLRRSWPVPGWHTWALCGGMPFSAFFGAANDERPTMKRSEISAARAVCAGCPVKRECLQWALERREQFGVWGGTSGRQRARMHHDMRVDGLSPAKIVEDWLELWLGT